MNMKPILALLLLIASAHAQSITPVAQLPNMVAVAIESATSTVTTVTSTTSTQNLVIQICYQGACAPPQTNPTFPLAVDCSVDTSCALLGGDPSYGNLKTLYMQEQPVAYTASVAGIAAPVPIPALPVVVVTPPPAKTLLGSNFTCTGISIYSDLTMTVSAANCTPPITGVTP